MRKRKCLDCGVDVPQPKYGAKKRCNSCAKERKAQQEREYRDWYKKSKAEAGRIMSRNEDRAIKRSHLGSFPGDYADEIL